jgi:hypothetical protein
MSIPPFAAHALRAGRELARRRAPELGIVAFAILLRLSMTLTYPITSGFDYPTHREYIQWIFQHSGLPRFDLNVATYHPPLYYVVAALALHAGIKNQHLGLVSIAAGCAWMILFWVALERYVSRRRLARVVALSLAAIFPSAIHLDGMLSNESLSTFFCLLAMVFIPETLTGGEDRRRLRAGLALGVALGLALLTKISVFAIIVAFAASVIIDLRWTRAGGSLGLRALALRTRPAVVAALVTATLAGWFFARNKVLYGKLAPTGYDGPAHVVVDGLRRVPYLDRRTIGYVAGFSFDIFAQPYYPSGSGSSPRFFSALLASTFVDNLNYGFAPRPRPGEIPLLRYSRPITAGAVELSSASVSGGAVVALATMIAWFAALRQVWRRRQAGMLALLLIPLCALLLQLHFAIEYPNDPTFPSKGSTCSSLRRFCTPSSGSRPLGCGIIAGPGRSQLSVLRRDWRSRPTRSTAGFHHCPQRC